MIVRRWQAFLAAALLLSACSERGELAQARSPLATEAPLPTAEAPAPATGTLDRWLGRWNGPEGTYLLLARNDDGGYVLEIADLDGPRRFEAAADGDALRFERNGQTERVRATDGQATGMKWLLEKSDCLTVKSGEGYCRD
ncbi:MAG TPA: hypothetical protein VGE51_04825 [Fontimonas sp.]